MDTFTNLDLLIYALAISCTAVFSGIAGGGGGFIATPLLILLGLSPAQAVASGKFGGLFVSAGSIRSMRDVEKVSKRQQVFFILLAVVAGILSPFIIKNLDSEVYKNLIGIFILLMIPIVMKKKIGHSKSKVGKTKQQLGIPLLFGALLIQGVFSGGMGTMVLIIMMYFYGMSALTANVTKRTAQLVLNFTVIIGVIASGLVVWKVAIVGAAIAFLGGLIGGKIATKKGNKFVMNVLIVLMLISGLALIVS